MAFIDYWRKASVEPVWLVRIYITDSDDNDLEFEFTSSKTLQFGLPASVSSVSPIAAELDAVSRKMTVGGTDVVFYDDGSIRDLENRYGVTGRKIGVFLGTTEIASTADFSVRFTGRIEAVVSDGSGFITLRATDLRADRAQMTISPDYIGQHPLEILEDIIQQTQGAANGQAETTSGFDPAEYEHPHWLTTYVSDESLRAAAYSAKVSPTTASETAIDELLLILGGTLLYDRDGSVRYKAYDLGAGAVRHLNDDDISAVRVRESGLEPCNLVTIDNGFHKLTPYAYSGRTPLFDSRSIQDEFQSNPELQALGMLTRMRWSSTAGQQEIGRVVERVISTSHFRNFSRVIATDNGSGGIQWGSGTIGSSTGERIGIELPEMMGFCGSATDEGGDNLVASSGTVYLVLINPNKTLSSWEFVAAEVVAIDYPSGGTVKGWKGAGSKKNPKCVQYQLTQRGLWGTSPETFPVGSFVMDVTLARATAARILSRFAAGIQVIEVDASPHHIDLELGDFVSIENPVPQDYIFDQTRGVNSDTLWEIVSKEEAIDEDPPRVTLVLAWAFSEADGFTPVETFEGSRFDSVNRSEFEALFGSSGAIRPWFRSGGTIS